MASNLAEVRARSEPEQGAGSLEIWAWAMYDFANSGYTTVVLTAIFNAYFVAVVAAGAPWATFAWTVPARLSKRVAQGGRLMRESGSRTGCDLKACSPGSAAT